MHSDSLTGGQATSFLRWAGSKKQLLPVLSSFWNATAHTRYVEPFAGSARLFFSLAPQRALLSDIHVDLVETMKAVQQHPESIATHLRSIPSDEATYYSLRNSDLFSEDASRRAAKFIYLNRRCFNGLYRTNLNGKFNVPYGGTKGGSLPDQKHLESCSLLLSRAEINSCDFEETLSAAQRGDFVYIDPPFSVRSRRTFKEYDRAHFGIKSLIRLRTALVDLAHRKVAFVLSYADCPEATFLAAGFEQRIVEVRRSIAGFAAHRQHSRELIAINEV